MSRYSCRFLYCALVSSVDCRDSREDTQEPIGMTLKEPGSGGTLKGDTRRGDALNLSALNANAL